MARDITVTGQGGEYMETVTLVEWAAKVGDEVEAGEVVAVVETAKATTEVEAPASGVLSAVYAQVGEEIDVGKAIGTIGGEIGADAPRETAAASPAPAAPKASERQPAAHRSSGDRIVASPLARRTARERGINLDGIQGSGPNGRIKLRDLQVEAETNADTAGPLHATRSGRQTGTPICLLHGFGTDTNIWKAVERDLARRHAVIRIDLPGHGKSPPAAQRDFRSLARTVVGCLDDLALEAAHLVGHSLGGALALAAADIRAPRFKSLCLLAPAGLGPEIDGAFVAGFCRASRPESLQPWLRRMVHEERFADDDVARAAMALRRSERLREGQSDMAATLFADGVQTFDLRPALRRLDLPARIVWGRNDAIIPWRHALAAPGHVGIHLLDDVGHVPQMEAPGQVVRILEELIVSS